MGCVDHMVGRAICSLRSNPSLQHQRLPHEDDGSANLNINTSNMNNSKPIIIKTALRPAEWFGGSFLVLMMPVVVKLSVESVVFSTENK